MVIADPPARLSPEPRDEISELGRTLFFQADEDFSAGDFESALRHLDMALDEAPGDPDILNNRGVALMHLELTSEALESFDQAYSARPDVLPVMNRGVALGLAGDHDGALREFIEAHRLEPEDSEVRYNLGHAHQHLGQYEEAIGHYQRLLDSKLPHYKAQYNLLLCLELLGEHEEALTQVNRALDFWDDAGELADLRREILDALLKRLTRSGFASWSGGKPKGSDPPIEITPGPPISDLIHQMR